MIGEAKEDQQEVGRGPIAKTLVWHRLVSNGFIPSGREGHSSVGANMKMYVFGGMETGRRVNTTQVLDVKTGTWMAKAVGNRDLRIEAKVQKDATNEDDSAAHKDIGQAESIDSKADFDPDAVQSDNPNVPTPRCHHAACVIEFDVDVKQLPKKKLGKRPIIENVMEPVTKRMQLMLIHGGEGTKMTGQDASIRVDVEEEREVVIEEPATHNNKITETSSSKQRHSGKGSLRDTQFGHSLRPTEQKKKLQEKAHAKQRRVQIQESKLMDHMDSKVERLPQSSSEKGGVCVQDSLQNTAHRTAGLKIEYQKSPHLIEAVDVNLTKSMEKGILANNQVARLATQSVVALEDIYALDINNDEWIKFDTLMGPLPRKGHTLSVAPVSRAALGMGSSGDDINPDRIIANRDKRLGRIHNHQSPDADGGDDGSLTSGEVKSDPRVQCVLLFGGHNADSEAYSNTVHLATVENIATSFIHLNQLQQEERQEREKSKGDNNGDSSDESESEATETGSAAMKKRRGISELQKEEIRKHNSIKWRVVPTHGTPPPERYRHSATVVRHKRCDKDRGGRGGSTACSLVVYGGLGRGNIPCNDVYILDLDSLEWIELTPTTSAAKKTWPVNGLYGHCGLPMHLKGMWARNGETDGEEEDEDVFGNIPLSAAARLAASTAGMHKEKEEQQALTRGGAFGAFGEKNARLTPEESANMFQDVLLVYGGSGGNGGRNGHGREKNMNALYMAYDHKIEARNVAASDALHHQEIDEREFEDTDIESQIKHAKSSGTTHVTKCLDLTTGEWRELTGSITYPSARVNHSMALVKGWAPGNPARIAIRVGDQHHMTSMPPAPELGSSGKAGSGHIWKSSDMAAAARDIKGGGAGDGEHERDQDTCAVVFGGSSVSMCLPDAWCLDLKWRVAGVKGFDSHASSRTRDALRESIEWASRTQYTTAGGAARHLHAAMHHAEHEHHDEVHMADPNVKRGTHIDLDLDENYDTTHMRMTGAQLQESVSAGPGATGQSATINFNHLHLTPAEIESQYAELTAAFRKVKKERAHAELQIKKERQRSFECLLRADRAEKDLRYKDKEYASYRVSTAKQVDELKSTIAEQNGTIAKLKTLSDDLLREKEENEKVIQILSVAVKAHRKEGGIGDDGFAIKQVF